MNRVNEIDFWKERIDSAKRQGVENYSVYLANPTSWASIEQIHKTIIKKKVRGKVLDAGCGYGRASEWVSDYTGVDFSPDFIKLAKEKYPDKKFIVGNLKELPFKDKEFDWAVCVSIRNMIKSYENPKAWNLIEKELRRVANKVLILEYVKPEIYEIL